jgi:hypothetical protein
LVKKPKTKKKENPLGESVRGIFFFDAIRLEIGDSVEGRTPREL